MVLGGSRFGLFAAAGSGGDPYAMYWAMASDAVVTKWLFTDDSRSTLAATLDYGTWGGAGISNSGVSGYMIGGANGPQNTYVQKLLYATEATSTLGSPTAYFSAVYETMGLSNHSVAGYSSGGCCDIGAYHKVAFPSETVSTISATLSTARDTMSGFTDSGTAGYSCGGTTPLVTLIDKLTYSTEANSIDSATLTNARGHHVTCANAGVAGYQYGGQVNNEESPGSGGWRDGGDKFAFPSMTRTNTSSGFLSNYFSMGAGGSNSGVAGYMGGGQYKWTQLAAIDRFAFPSDTRTALAAPLDNLGDNQATMSNEGSLA